MNLTAIVKKKQTCKRQRPKIEPLGTRFNETGQMANRKASKHPRRSPNQELNLGAKQEHDKFAGAFDWY